MSALSAYGKVSGQQVNYHKSAILFGKNCSTAQQTLMQTITCIPKVGGFDKYLGLPEIIPQHTSNAFSYLTHRIHTKIEHWTSQILSPVGKEILIKAVITALPAYTMQCFLLPKTLLKRLTQMIRRFWWSGAVDRTKIPWVSWDKITRSKSTGGIGIHDLQDFNVALIAKQAWRLLTCPNSLFGRIYKAKYYPKSFVLEATKGNNSSYVWKGIYQGIKHIEKGMYWTVGNSKTIRIWQDKWVPKNPPDKAIIRWSGCNPQEKVHQLLTNDGNNWCNMKLAQTLSADDIEHVQRIRPTFCDSEDQPTWQHTKSGEYSAKSGYHMLHMQCASVEQGDDTTLFKRLWQVNIPNKIKHFWWRSLHNSLAVAHALRRRGLNVDPLCQRCGNGTEDVNHLLFKCRISAEIWHLCPSSPFTDSNPIQDCLKHNINCVVMQQLPSSTLVAPVGLFLGWLIWKMRNDIIFNNLQKGIPDIINKALAELTAWSNAMSLNSFVMNNATGRKRPTDSLSNHALLNGSDHNSFSVFTDGSWLSPTAKAGIGWVMYGASTRILQGYATIQPAKSALEVEFLAVLEVLQVLRRFNYQTIHILCDCKMMIDALTSWNNGHGDRRNWIQGLSTYILDISTLVASFASVKFSYVSRMHNALTDSLAKKARLGQYSSLIQ